MVQHETLTARAQTGSTVQSMALLCKILLRRRVVASRRRIGAKSRGLPVEYVDIGVLSIRSRVIVPIQDTFCGADTCILNRFHGYLIQKERKKTSEDEPPNFWLVLDEVVDPQKLGALIRLAYYLGGSKFGLEMGAKNSDPSVAGRTCRECGRALELLDVVQSTLVICRGLGRRLREDDFRIIGASAVPTNNAVGTWIRGPWTTNSCLQSVYRICTNRWKLGHCGRCQLAQCECYGWYSHVVTIEESMNSLPSSEQTNRGHP